MLRSLVGSEMCIRDRPEPRASLALGALVGAAGAVALLRAFQHKSREPSPGLAGLSGDLVASLKEKSLHITTVESCTGGGLACWITNVSGASSVIKGARVTYSNEEKILLGVPKTVIDEFSVYSEQTAVAMARAGIAAAAKAEIGVGITGSISRVDPNNPNSEPGVVYFGVVYGNNVVSRKCLFADQGERWEVKDRAIEVALKMVLDVLDGT
eukprot:TRINITY_DN26673_c0_g1_i1.p1 TRINITY_DN26673_c0_g1~~TRINITY_DN26673_c0_g1_i1.p1  ORF type:complete len:212 (-),score=61.68 TRINITY_DN26673_c0_g1_i1:323-958(-)